MCYLVKNTKLTYKINLGYLSPGIPQEDNHYTVLELEEILEIIVFISLILPGHHRVFRVNLKTKNTYFPKIKQILKSELM